MVVWSITANSLLKRGFSLKSQIHGTIHSRTTLLHDLVSDLQRAATKVKILPFVPHYAHIENKVMRCQTCPLTEELHVQARLKFIHIASGWSRKELGECHVFKWNQKSICQVRRKKNAPKKTSVWRQIMLSDCISAKGTEWLTWLYFFQ